MPSTNNQRLNAVPAFSFVLLACAFIGVYWRIYYGIDFTDEAFYSALPYSLTLGNLPLQHELSLAENSSVLMWPFYALYYWFMKSSDGMLLFNRHLYFCYLCATIVLTVIVKRKVFTPGGGALIASIVVLLTNNNLLALGYRTIGTFSFLIGCLLFTWSSQSKSKTPLCIFAVLFLGMSTYAYPGLLVASALTIIFSTAILSFGQDKDTAVKTIRGVGIGLFIGLLLVAFLLYIANWEHLVHFSEYLKARRIASPIMGRIFNLLNLLQSFADILVYFTVSCLCVGYFTARKNPSHDFAQKVIPYLIPLTVLVSYLLVQKRELFATMAVTPILCFALLTPLSLVFSKRSKETNLTLLLLWVPGIASFLSLGYSSQGRFQAAGLVGAIPCIVASLYLYSEQTKTFANRSKYYCLFLLAATLVPIQLHSLYSSTYRDKTISFLTERVNEGPFAALYTTPQKKRFIVQLQRDLQEIGNNGTLMVYDRFPAGYLFTSLRPQTHDLWPFWNPSSFARKTLEHFVKNRDTPDYVLEIKATDLTKEFHLYHRQNALNPFAPYFREIGYKVIIERDDYRVLQKPNRDS